MVGRFVSGEGSFLINTLKATTNLGMGVRLTFKLSQHVRDEKLMTSLIDYLGCGGGAVIKIEKFLI